MAQTLGCHNEGNTIIAQASRHVKNDLILSLILSFMRMGAIRGGDIELLGEGVEDKIEAKALFPWSHFHGSNFKKCNLKAFGSLTRCKRNANQEKWPCPQKVHVLIFFLYMFKMDMFGKKIHVWPSTLFPFSFPINRKNDSNPPPTPQREKVMIKNNKTTFLCHYPLAFVMREFFLPIPL